MLLRSQRCRTWGWYLSRMNARWRTFLVFGLRATAVLAVAGTYLAARIDFVQRHRPGIAQTRYVLPQVMHVWLPGIGLAVALFVAAQIAGRAGRRL